MSESSPASILQAAADRIRDLAAAATTGRWDAQHSLDGDGWYPSSWVEATVVRANGSQSGFVLAEFETEQRAGDAAWVAALSPAVAPALERLLRDAAKDWDVRTRVYTPEALEQHLASRRFAGAIALARLLCPELVEEDQK